jgi:hypothetical protein
MAQASGIKSYLLESVSANRRAKPHCSCLTFRVNEHPTMTRTAKAQVRCS